MTYANLYAIFLLFDYPHFSPLEPSDRFYPAGSGMLYRLCEVFVAHEV